MAADTYLAIGALRGLSGEEVSAYIGGLDCGDYVVDATDTIYVPLGSDAGGLLTADYISSIAGWTGVNQARLSFDPDGNGKKEYVIPVVVGLSMDTRLRLLRPIAEVDLKSTQGPSIGTTRRIHQVAALFINTVTVSIGANFDILLPTSFTNVTPIATDLFNGVHWMPIDDEFDFDGQATFELTRPGPLTITAITSFIETNER